MFETGVRQFRMAMAMVGGRRISPRVIERLTGDVLATLREFGAPGDDVRVLLDGPLADPESREHFQLQALRRTVRRLGARSAFYAKLLADIDVRRLTLSEFQALPLTSKADLVNRGPDLICHGATPYLSTRTTGTTGKPAEIWMSAYEARLWPALGALSGLLRGELRPSDCLQVNISSRATAAVQHAVETSRLAGARARVLGQVPIRQSLDSLLDREPTILSCYPSYLAMLVTEAQRQGLAPADFNLRIINVGGEVLSPALRAAAEGTFGAPITDTFGMTEILPVSGRFCDAGHLHPDLNMGFVEVVAPEGTEPAAPGELGRMVVTPYFPYRDCMALLRYDTADLVRRLPDGPLGCELAAIPAVSAIQGKASQAIATRSGTVTTRDIVEVLEALPSQPWPARYRATELGGVLLLTIPESALDGLTTAEVARRFADRGIDAAVEVSSSELRRVRADLAEATFAVDAVTTGG
jgi:phenylacetate-coenzyme A ligase PaaK-like adenylate-forming protein